MKKTACILLACLACWTARSAEQVELFLTLTNTPVTGDTLTVNGATRTWTNAHSSLTILTNLADFPTNTATTNLYFNLSAYFLDDLPIVLYSSSNELRLVFGVGTAVSASQAGDWVSVSYVTNTITQAKGVRVPITVESAANRTNIASGIVEALQYATNSIADGWVVGTNLARLALNNAFTGTNSLSQGGWNNGKFTNSLDFSGIVSYLTNGYWTNAILGNPTMTNGVNYGNSFSSPGSGTDSLQLGVGATATASSSMAVGDAASATNTSSIALGAGAVSWGNSAIAIGVENVAGAQNSMAIGTGASVDITSTNSIAIGSAATIAATHTNSIALGNGVTSTETNQILIGKNIHKVRVPGRLEVTGQITNAVFTGTNSIGVSGGSGPYGFLAFRRYNNTSLANGNNAGVDPNGATYMKVSGPTADFTLNGIDGGEDGYFLIIENVTGYNMTVANDSGVDPVAANRIYTRLGSDLTFPGKSVLEFIYDSAESRWILMDVDVGPVYGQVYTHSNAGALTITTAGTYYSLTNLNTAGEYNGTTLDASAGTITTPYAGTYVATFDASFSGTASATIEYVLFTNSVSTGFEIERKLGTGGDIGVVSMQAIIAVPTNVVWEIKVTSDGNGDTATTRHAQLGVTKVK